MATRKHRFRLKWNDFEVERETFYPDRFWQVMDLTIKVGIRVGIVYTAYVAWQYFKG